MRPIRASLVALVYLLLATSAAHAETVVDENLGYWLDGYGDSSGLYGGPLAITANVRHDPAGGLVTLDDPGQDGAFVTELITPASFSAWTTVRVAYSASTTNAVTVAFRDEATGTEYPVTLSPTSGAWTATGPLGVPASVTRGRLVVRLTHGPVPPTVSALEVRWTPKSVVGVGITSVQSTVCAADTITYRVGTAVSFVNADRLVVYAPMPEAVDNDDPLAEPTFVSATAGGALNGGTPRTLGAVTVPANAVYWDLGPKNAGETFILGFVVRTRMGTRDGTTYEASAFAGAMNAEPAAAPTTLTTLESRPAPWIRKSVGGAFRINGADYADPGTALTFYVGFGNYAQPPTRCGETYRDAVIYDDVSEVLTAAGVATIPDEAISDGGHFTSVALPNVAGSGVDVPANSVYWLVGDLPVSSSFSRSYEVTLQSGTLVHSQAWARSAEHTESASASHTLHVGIPWQPNGIFALGDRVRGSTQISAADTDNRYKTIGYGDVVTFLPYVSNGGASSLEDVVMIATVPAGTHLDSVYAPTGAEVRYCAESDCPRPVALESLTGWNGATGVIDPAIWSDTAPADATVVWFRIPHLASPFFPEAGVPTSATTEVTVVVDQPAAECPEMTVRCDTSFEVFGYTPQGGARVDNDTSGPALALYEPVEVIPTVPDLSGTRVSAIPAATNPGDTVRYHVSIPNAASGGGPTDTALDVVATLTLPQVRVNGVLTRLSFADISTGGGTVSLDELPERVVVRYPKIFPSQTKTIDLTVAVPRGVVNGTTASLLAQVAGNDDVCGAVASSAAGTTTILGEPYLAVTKQVDFSVAGPGSELEYSLVVRNTGDSPSTRTWVVDRVPADATFVSARAFPHGSVWFSAATEPALPGALTALAPLDGPQIAGNFVVGAVDGGGRWTSPFGVATTWVAFSLDDPSLAPAQLVTDSTVGGSFRVRLRDDAENGSVLTNEGAVLSSELLQSIGNRVRTTIATRPSLVLDKTCPAIVAAGEHFTYQLAYVNDSTNEDTSVAIEDVLPDGVTYVGYSHAYNDAVPAGAGLPTLVVDGQTLRWDVTGGLGGALGSRGGGVLTVEVVADADVPSGTTVVNQATGEAANEVGTFVVFDDCPTLVENADLYARAAVDNARPRSGEVATFTLFVSNEGAHDAALVTVSEVLPAGLTYVPGSARVVTAGYQLAPAMAPTIIGNTLIWSPSTGNAITRTGGAAGAVPGRSGDVLLTFQARVDAGVAPGTALESCVHLSTTTVEDPLYTNDACVTVTTPLPDPAIQLTGPAFIRPRTTVSYTLTYANQENEDAAGVYFVIALPDGPTPANGAVDLTYVGAIAPHGEALWFASATAGDPAVTFDPLSPASGGWTQTPGALPSVTHVAVVVGAMPAYDGPYTVSLQLLAVDPTTGLGPQAGARIEACAHITSATPDDDPSNNDDCHEARTPGVDVAAVAACDPSGALPGIAPGGVILVDATLENTGTVDAFGLTLTPTLPAGATLVGDGSGAAVVTGAGGGESAPVDVSGIPVSDTVPWTRVGDRLVLGSADESSPFWYRKIGLSPGDRATVRLSVRLPDTLADNTVFTTGATAGADLRFDAAPALREELLENNVGACSALVYRADVFVSKRVVNATTGSETLAAAGDVLAYTIEYGNAGHFAASDVILDDPVPPGASFVVGSVANLFTDAVIIEYDDGSQSWSYTPAAPTGQPDPRIRAFRVRWRDPLAAPANNIFSQSTAVAFARDALDGVVADPSRDALHPIAAGAGEGRPECANKSCDGSPLYCSYGWTIPDGECCPVCRPSPECPRVETSCDESYYECEDGDCEVCEPTDAPTVAWEALRSSCYNAVNTAYLAYRSCLTAGGTVASCAGLEVHDAWTTCAGLGLGLPTSCPAIPAGSCEWSDYGHAMLSAFDNLRGMYADCLETVPGGEESHCDGLRPRSDFVGCVRDTTAAMCPGASAPGCQWSSYQSLTSSLWGHLTSSWTSCRDVLGDHALCGGLETPHFGETCMMDGDACPRLEDGACAWRTQLSACDNVYGHERSFYQSTCLGEYGAEACTWAMPADVCRPCQEAGVPSPTAPPCALQDWSDRVTSTDFNRVWDFLNCHQTVSAAGGDPMAACSGLQRSMVLPNGLMRACPGPGAPLAAWVRYTDELTGVHASLSFYRNCVDRIGVERCGPFEVDWGGSLGACFEDAPRDTACELDAWQGSCSSQATSLMHGYTDCILAVGKESWQRCAGAAQGYFCAPPIRDLCEELEAEGRPDLDALRYSCYNKHQYSANYAYANCFITVAEPWDDNDTFSPDLAFTACAALADVDACSRCRTDCYSDDPQIAEGQIRSCVDMDSNDYHSLWGGSCIDPLTSPFDSQGVPAPDEVFERCASQVPQATVCGVNPPSCETRATVARIPEDPSETVLAWDRFLATTDPGAYPVTFDLHDAETGAPLPGLTELDLGDLGVADLSGLDPGEVRAITLSATFHGGPDACVEYMIPPEFIHGTYSQGNRALQIGARDYRTYPDSPTLITRGKPNVNLRDLVDNASEVRLIGEGGHVVVGTYVEGQPSEIYVLTPETPNGVTFSVAHIGSSNVYNLYDINSAGWMYGNYREDGVNRYVIMYPESPTSYGTLFPDDTTGGSLGENGVLTTSGADGHARALVPVGTPPSYVAVDLPTSAPKSSAYYPLSNGVIPGWAISADNVQQPIFWRPTGALTYEEVIVPELVGRESHSSVGGRLGFGEWFVHILRAEDGTNDIVFIHTGTGPVETWDVAVTTGVPGEWGINGWLSPDGSLLLSHYTSGRTRIRVYFPDGTWVEAPRIINNTVGLVAPGGAVIGLVSSSGRPMLWQPRCERAGQPWLDAWSLLYTTDKNPTFDYQLEVADVCQTAVTNTVDMSSTTPEITDANNRASATIAVETADVRVAIAADKSAVLESDTLTWTISWWNDGPGVARDAVVSALFGDLFVPDDNGSVGPWPLGDVAPGASGAITVTGSLDGELFVPNLTLNAGAAIDTATIDCAPDNDDAGAAVATGGFPNLTVTVGGPAVLTPGASGTYTILYANSGNLTVDEATVSALLPAGLTITAVGQGGSETADGADWTVGPLAPGQTGQVTITVAAPGCDAVGQTLRVDAEIAPTSLEVAESSTTDNAASTATRLSGYTGRVDLLGAVDRATAESGDELIYTAHWAAAGAGAVRNAEVSAALPPGVALVEGSISAGGTFAEGVITWALGDLLSGDRGAVSWRVRVTTGPGAQIAATALAASADNLCDSAGATPPTSVTEGGLHLVATAGTPAVCGPRGDTIGWTILVSNTSDAPVDGVVVTDAVPAGVNYVGGSMTGPGASAQTAPVLVWTVGTIPARTAYTLGFQTSAPAGGGVIVSNSARVEAPGMGAATSAAATVVSDCNGRLDVTKSWDAACALASGEHTVRLTWRNTGAALVNGAVVRDVVPRGADFVAVEGGSFDVQSGVVTFAVPPLAPGQSGSGVFHVTLSGAPGAPVANAASVTATGLHAQVSNTVAGALLACDDGNACTVDRCEPALGCVFPAEPAGTACDDLDACTQLDRCMDGACVGSDPVACEALDACHVVGVCDPATGACSNPAGNDEAPCDDGDACTTASACSAGACVGIETLGCDDGNDCTVDGCDVETGCTNEPADGGASCDDGDACTRADACDGDGTCVGADPVVCSASDQCHYPGVCDSATGACTDPAVPDGMLCDDGDLCTAEDTCVEGVCGGADVTCAAPDACHFPGVCNEATGVCDYEEKPGDVPVPIHLRDLGTLGGEASEALAVNAAGAVVGWAEAAGGDPHAFWWTAEGGMVDLAPEATRSRAFAVNDAGRALFVVDDDGVAVWLRGEDGAASALGAVPGFDAEAFLNAAGEVAFLGTDGGHFFAADGTGSAVTSPSGTLVSIDGLGASGDVFGAYDPGDGVPHGYVWRDGTARDVGGVGVIAVDASGGALKQVGTTARFIAADGVATDFGSAIAVDVSDEGVVIGVDVATGRAFLWSAAAGVVDLGTLGGPFSEPVAVNAAGQVVGVSDTLVGPRHAFLWDGGVMTDLGALGGASTPVALSDSGFVAGTSITASGAKRVFLWSAARGLEDLGALGAGDALVRGLNEAGRVIGADGRGFVSDTPRTACVVCAEDAVPPTIICPVFKASVECVLDGAEVSLGQPSVSDACGGPVAVTSDAPAVFAPGTTAVTFTATDLTGNQASCTTTVTVEDTTGPTLLCPEDVTVEADANVCGSEVELAITATDACDGADDITVFTSAPAVFPVGATTVHVQAVDRAGNGASCDTVVTVVDVSTPTLTCPEALTVDAPADSCVWEEPLTATLSQECAPELSVTVEDKAYPIGTSDVTFRANAAGQELTCATALTVRDVTAPTVLCNAPTEVAFEQLPIVATARAADACGVEVTVAEPDCADCVVTDQTVTVYAVGEEGGVATWVVTATDPSGNATDETCTVTVAAPVGPDEPDRDDLVANGGGGCAGGGGAGGLALSLALLTLFALRRRRRGTR